MNEHEFATLTKLAYSYAFRVLGDHSTAEDIAQDAIERLCNCMVKPTDKAAWVYKTASNLCLNEIRRKARRAAPIGDDAEEIQDDIDGTEIIEFIEEKLPRDEAGALIQYSQGHTIDDISAIRSISYDQARYLITRARRRATIALATIGISSVVTWWIFAQNSSPAPDRAQVVTTQQLSQTVYSNLDLLDKRDFKPGLSKAGVKDTEITLTSSEKFSEVELVYMTQMRSNIKLGWIMLEIYDSSGKRVAIGERPSSRFTELEGSPFCIAYYGIQGVEVPAGKYYLRSKFHGETNNGGFQGVGAVFHNMLCRVTASVKVAPATDTQQ